MHQLTHIGLDVHKDTIAAAVLRPGTIECDERVIPNTPETVRRAPRCGCGMPSRSAPAPSRSPTVMRSPGVCTHDRASGWDIGHRRSAMRQPGRREAKCCTSNLNLRLPHWRPRKTTVPILAALISGGHRQRCRPRHRGRGGTPCHLGYCRRPGL